jgi:hypothetical protein
MELRCPQCCSPEVEPDPQGSDEERRCANCGERFPRDAALVTVLDAEAHQLDAGLQQLFTCNPTLAAVELGRLGGAIATASPHSDADELNALLEGAQAAGVISAERERARLYAHSLSVGDPEPLLAVDPGAGPTLLGCPVKLRQHEGEDPISFTVRVLEQLTGEANGLAAGRAADRARLDRIAAYMNANRPWPGADVCEFVATELRESGRVLLDAED